MELIVTHPGYCPKKEFDHSSDTDMESHGTPEAPIEVEEKRQKKYVHWEYEHIMRAMPTPYTKCQQQLYGDAEDRRLDRIVVRDVGGKHHAFWFNVTEQMAEGQKYLEKAYADWKAGKPVKPEDVKAFKAAEDLKERARRQRGAGNN